MSFAFLLPGLWLGGLLTSSVYLARLVDRRQSADDLKVPDRG